MAKQLLQAIVLLMHLIPWKHSCLAEILKLICLLPCKEVDFTLEELECAGRNVFH